MFRRFAFRNSESERTQAFQEHTQCRQAYFQFIVVYCNSMPQNRKRLRKIYRLDRRTIFLGSAFERLSFKTLILNFQDDRRIVRESFQEF